MDYREQWQSRMDQLLDEAFSEYCAGMDLYYFINDKVSGMHQGKFPVPRSEGKGNPIAHEVLRKTLPDRLKCFDPKQTDIRLEWH